MAKAFYDGKGTIYCECGQLLGATQRICPACKQNIIQYVKAPNMISRNGGNNYYYQRSASPTSKKFSGTIAVLVGIIVVLLFLLLKSNGVFKSNANTAPSTVTNEAANNISLGKLVNKSIFNPLKHSEAPLGYSEEAVAGSFDFYITQVFFQAEENEITAGRLKCVLIGSGVEYENFYYSEEGYYTADLLNLGPYSRTDYEKISQEIEDKISEEMVLYEAYGIEMVLQGYYSHY